MLNSKKNNIGNIDTNVLGKSNTTIISAGASFDGTLNSSGIVRIDGIFGGGMNIDGTVIIGEDGYIKGNIKAERITIAGKVEGNIYAKGTLELTSSGKLYGDIEVKNVSIADGAIFQGKCIMIQQNIQSYDNTESLIETAPPSAE